MYTPVFFLKKSESRPVEAWVIIERDGKTDLSHISECYGWGYVEVVVKPEEFKLFRTEKSALKAAHSSIADMCSNCWFSTQALPQIFILTDKQVEYLLTPVEEKIYNKFDELLKSAPHYEASFKPVYTMKNFNITKITK